jgi:gluconokinase
MPDRIAPGRTGPGSSTDHRHSEWGVLPAGRHPASGMSPPAPETPSMAVPCLIVFMGVSGAGKSTLARALSETLCWRYVEADDFHSPENRRCMAAGQPLSDAQRAPWMSAICAELSELADAGDSCVLAHSAIRRAHRDQLRRCGLDTRFIHLTTAPELIEQRLAHRSGHFMPASLLHSQLEAFQSAKDEADVIELEASEPPPVLQQRTITVLSEFLDERTIP